MNQANIIKLSIVLRPQWSIFYFIFFLWLLVLLPSSVEASQFFLRQESLKNDFSFLVGDFNFFPRFSESLGKRFNVFSEMEYFVYESGTESGGCFVEFRNTVDLECIPITNPRTEERTNNSKTTSNKCYFVGTEVQFWLALLCGGLGGAIISIILLKGIFYFIHTTPELSRSVAIGLSDFVIFSFWSFVND